MIYSLKTGRFNYVYIDLTEKTVIKHCNCEMSVWSQTAHYMTLQNDNISATVITKLSYKCITALAFLLHFSQTWPSINNKWQYSKNNSLDNTKLSYNYAS